MFDFACLNGMTYQQKQQLIDAVVKARKAESNEFDAHKDSAEMRKYHGTRLMVYEDIFNAVSKIKVDIDTIPRYDRFEAWQHGMKVSA